MKTEHPDFPFSISRDFLDTEIEVTIQVLHYRPPGNNRGLDHRDPAYDPGVLEFGEAHTLDGKTIELTELEKEAAETRFWEKGIN